MGLIGESFATFIVAFVLTTLSLRYSASDASTSQRLQHSVGTAYVVRPAVHCPRSSSNEQQQRTQHFESMSQRKLLMISSSSSKDQSNNNSQRIENPTIAQQCEGGEGFEAPVLKVDGPPVGTSVKVRGQWLRRFSDTSCFPPEGNRCGILIWSTTRDITPLKHIHAVLQKSDWLVDFPVSVVTNDLSVAELSDLGFNRVKSGATRIPEILQLSPYHRTLFFTDRALPSDGALSAPPTLMLARLDHFDAVLTTLPHWDSEEIQVKAQAVLGKSLLTEALYHPGLILFRQSGAWRDLLAHWVKVHDSHDCKILDLPVCSFTEAQRRSVARVRAIAPYHCVDPRFARDRCRCAGCGKEVLQRMTQC